MKRRNATPEQIAKAKEKRAKIRDLAKQIGAMSEDQRRQMVGDWPTTIEGHAVSTHNACLLAYQGGASVIGGFRQWKKAGRFVRKGEHGKSIWIPLGFRKVTQDDGEVKEEGDCEGFTLATVFDISQTEACETQEPKPYQIERTLAPFPDGKETYALYAKGELPEESANQEPPQWDEIQPNEHDAPEYTDNESAEAFQLEEVTA